MKKLAIIPARSKSKRIPGKNIKNFLGKPIIQYSIEAALKSNLFDEIMVSTDVDTISKIAKSLGAKVPFLRSEKNADDHASTAAVVEEVLDTYLKYNKSFDYFCCIYPTAPFISKNILCSAYTKLIESNFDSVFPLVKFSYPIQRGLEITNNKVKMLWPENISKRSQDLKDAYHDAGQFYWMKTDAFLEKKCLYTENSGAIILSEMEVQDIDNYTDWEIAELKYNISRKTK